MKFKDLTLIFEGNLKRDFKEDFYLFEKASKLAITHIKPLIDSISNYFIKNEIKMGKNSGKIIKLFDFDDKTDRLFVGVGWHGTGFFSPHQICTFIFSMRLLNPWIKGTKYNSSGNIEERLRGLWVFEYGELRVKKEYFDDLSFIVAIHKEKIKQALGLGIKTIKDDFK